MKQHSTRVKTQKPIVFAVTALSAEAFLGHLDRRTVSTFQPTPDPTDCYVSVVKSGVWRVLKSLKMFYSGCECVKVMMTVLNRTDIVSTQLYQLL